MRLSSIKSCYLFPGLLSLSAAGVAQTENLETVTVTASRQQQLVDELAASLSTVSGEQLEQIGAVHISETLVRVPGVWISRGNGQEHLTAIRSPVLTGAGSCGAFAVAEDGVPVRATGFCNVNQLFDINTEQAGRIEVLRGPGTVLYGSDAQHGVINVLSRAPGESAEAALSLEGGVNDYRRIKASLGDSVDAHGYRVSFNGARDGGFKRDSGFDQQKLVVRHDYSLHDNSLHDNSFGEGDLQLRTLFSISNLNQETAGYVSGVNAYRDSERKRENPNPEAYRDSQSARLQTRIEKSGSAGELLIVTPYTRYTSMNFMMHFLPGTPVEENGQRSAGLQTFYRRPLGEHLVLNSGVDLEVTSGWLKQTQEHGFSSFPAGRQYDYTVDALVGSAFGSAEYALSADTSLTFGGRYEWLRYDYHNRMISGDTAEDGTPCVNDLTGAVGCRYSRPDDRRDAFGNLSMDASLLHALTDNLTGVLRLVQGFRAPQATEMYRLQNGQLDADLGSEKIDSVELGMRGGGEKLKFSLTGFYMEKANAIFQSAARLNASDGESRHYGLEYELLWRLGERWDLTSSGTLARHLYTADVTAPGSATSITTAGNDVDTAPRRMGSVVLGWSPQSATRVELEWLAMGRYYTDLQNLHSYGGHDLVHLRLRQQLGDRVGLGLRIHNLADADYAERAEYSSLGGGDSYFIGEPRAFYADLSLRF